MHWFEYVIPFSAQIGKYSRVHTQSSSSIATSIGDPRTECTTAKTSPMTTNKYFKSIFFESKRTNYVMHSVQFWIMWNRTEYLYAFNWTDAISCIYCIFKFAQVLSKWWSYHRFMSWDTKASVHVFFFFTTNTNHFRELKDDSIRRTHLSRE